jgi:hypothetical protein
MNPFSWIKGEVTDIYAKLVPASMQAELGTLAHAFVANIIYDMKQIGLKGEALVQEEVAAVWISVKATLAQVMSDPSFATLALSGQIGAAVTILVSDEAKNFIPALKNVGPVTIQNMVTSAGALLVAGIIDAGQGKLQDPAAASAALVSAAPKTVAAAAK